MQYINLDEIHSNMEQIHFLVAELNSKLTEFQTISEQERTQKINALSNTFKALSAIASICETTLLKQGGINVYPCNGYSQTLLVRAFSRLFIH